MSLLFESGPRDNERAIVPGAQTVRRGLARPVSFLVHGWDSPAALPLGYSIPVSLFPSAQPRPLNRPGGVAIEGADDAAGVQVQHALVVDVSVEAYGGGIPGDAAGVFAGHRGVGAVVDAAARRGGDVAGQGAAADRQRAVVVDAAA